VNIRNIALSTPVIGLILKYLNAIYRKLTTPNFSQTAELLLGQKKIQVVQIGSNDGVTGDPIHELLKQYKDWRALFVEPVPFLFERLKKNYPDGSRFDFENSIINDGSEVSFFWCSESAKKELDNLPIWWDQLGSFSRDHILSQLPIIEPYIVERRVRGITIMELLDKYSISNVDLLHIDAEGADFTILSQLDLNLFTPTIILFEHKHLTYLSKRKIISLLESRYKLYNLGDDVLAITKRVTSALPTWRYRKFRALKYFIQ
jgi:FkbM family methyltransferase